MIAQKTLPKFSGPYDSIEHFKKIYGETQYESVDHHRKVIKNMRDTDFVFQTRQQLLNLYLNLTFSQCKILDVGGGSNSIIHNLKTLGISADVYCLETDDFIQARKTISDLNDAVTFFKFDELSMIDVDVVYFGSVTQYFHDISEIANIIQGSSPTSIIIGGTILTDDAKLEGVYAQPSSIGGFQAYTVRHKTSICEFFKSIGYYKKFEIPEAEVLINLPTQSRRPIAWFQIYEHYKK